MRTTATTLLRLRVPLLLVALVVPAGPALAQTVQAGLFYDTATNELVVRLRPSATFSGTFTNVVFTILQPAANTATLGTPTGGYGVTAATSGTSGGNTYTVYASTPNNTINFTSGVDVEVARIPVTGGTSAQTAQLAPSTFLAGTTEDYYVEVNGIDRTNTATPFFSASTALPVELSAFEATRDGRAVVVRWTTQSETNNAGFAIEARRLDDPQALWRELQFVPGRGTTAEAQQYSYRAEGLTPGRYSFRLRQMDLDGTAHIAPAIEVDVEAARELALADPAPNPVRAATVFAFTVAESGPASLAVFDLLGREVARLFEERAEAGRAHRARLDASGLSAGVYVARLSSGTGVLTRSFTIVK